MSKNVSICIIIDYKIIKLSNGQHWVAVFWGDRKWRTVFNNLAARFRIEKRVPGGSLGSLSRTISNDW